MSRTLIEDAFAHHGWATVRLIDACAALSPGQLATAVPGTYGSILDTLRHMVEGDSFYLFVATGQRTPLIDAARMTLSELRGVVEASAVEWRRLVAENPDPDVVLRETDEDGFQRDAALGIRLAQALHHGNDHRTHVCTAMAILGVKPPGISAWDFGLETGRSVEVMTLG